MRRFLAYGLAALIIAAGAAGAWMYGTGRERMPDIAANSVEKQAADEHGAERVPFDDAKITAASIDLEVAGPRTLRKSLQLNGIVQANQETLAQVTARFPGVVRDVRKRLGDTVRKDEVLAVVESNQSLTSFELKAPIAGTVIERQVALGEYVSEQKPAFVIGDLASVWVDFSVYRRDFAKVAIGDAVSIDPEDSGAPIESRVAYISPLGASDTQSGLARSVVPNGGRLRPGIFVTGHLWLTARPVTLAVRPAALQQFEGRTVVFVREGQTFEARTVTLGERDRDWVEVTTGLTAGERYAAGNSFVVKADIGKSNDGHD